MKHALERRSVVFLILASLAALLSPAHAGADDRGTWSIHRHAALPGNPPARLVPNLLLLDDGSHEAEVGFNAASAIQFLWFNEFDSPSTLLAPFDLDEIQVLFPAGAEIVPGAAVELVVFHDPDSDPTNGADLLAAFDEVIQVADGTTFSVYPVDPPVVVPQGPGRLLVGVVNRFVVSGVSPLSRPAALDTTSSAGRSWVASWTGDPPDPPALPPDDVLSTIDFVEPGNWMIRASGALIPVNEIPTLGPGGLSFLAVLIVLAAAGLLRIRATPGSGLSDSSS